MADVAYPETEATGRQDVRSSNLPASGVVNALQSVTSGALNDAMGIDWGAAPEAAATGSLSLVRITKTSAWSPPAPDPAGIVYWPATGHLLMSDSEVDEMPKLFTGKNLYEMSLSGALLHTYTTTSFTKEPTGVAINPADGHSYVSQDGGNKIFDVNPGADGIPWTSDDKIREYSVSGFGVLDAEDLAFGGGKMLIADGKNTEVWVISPGANGRFDGPSSVGGDDTATHFDVSRYGARDVEGVAYHPNTGHIWVCSKKATILELTMSGSLVNSFDISSVGSLEPDGITIAPGSNNSSTQHVYVADRMVDNNINPSENDGRVYEFAINSTSATPTSAPVNSPTPTRTPTRTATPANTPLATNTPAATSTPGGTGRTVTINPDADSYVDSSNPSTNYGGSTQLRTDASPVVNSYLRFSVSGLSGTVTSVSLQVFANSSLSAGITASRVVDNSWAETTINYSNAPAIGSAIGQSGVITSGTWISINVTSYVTGNGTFSFALSDASSTALSMASRESTNKPRLVITTQ